MKAIVTGIKGTLAPVLAEELCSKGIEIVPWNRQEVPTDNPGAIQAFLDHQQPDAIYHLAMGSEKWAALLALYAAQHQCPFLFTSTAMVFDHLPNGPHQIHDRRSGKDDYGQYKCRCEDAILEANPSAIIARIGWQIHHRPRGNNMLAALHAMAEKEGHIDASTAWYPATSWMIDTADMLARLAAANRPGIYHLDSNAQSRLNFYQIVMHLKQRFQTSWDVRESDNYAHDQRLIDPVISMKPLFR